MANKKKGGFGYSPVNLTGPGTIFTLGFIAIAVGMGLLLTRGVTPKSTLTDPGQQDQEYEMILETPKPGEKGLQLKTIKFKECASTVTVDFLLDRSSSMTVNTPSGVTKIARLKEAVSTFFQNANDTSVVGIQSFSSPDGINPLITNDVPVSYYKDAKKIIPNAINNLFAQGSTPTHDALNFSYNILKNEVPKYKDRKFNFIFVSDGAPCPGIDCEKNISPTTPNQDPRLYSPNPADEIKKLGVTVYTLGIYASGQSNLPFLEKLLKSIATSPNHYYAASSGDQVKDLLKQISNKICSQENATPTP